MNFEIVNKQCYQVDGGRLHIWCVPCTVYTTKSNFEESDVSRLLEYLDSLYERNIKCST